MNKYVCKCKIYCHFINNPLSTIILRFCEYPAIILSSFSSDPKTLSSGSPSDAPARSGAETQHVPRRQLRFLLYVVFIPFPVTRRAGADIAALLISCAWYTSGNC